MRARLRARVALCAAFLLGSAGAAGAGETDRAADRFDVAVTVDDLPAHGPLPRGQTRAGIARSWLDTLARHGVAQAWGFVNARGLDDEPASAAALARWRGAGYPLGNHGYSHLGLSQAPSLAAWQADVARNEAALATYMGKEDWRWLRYPFLDAGQGARHDAALAWLGARGYRVADVTLGFDDWAYSEAYVRCLDAGDTAAIAALVDGYGRRVDQGIARTKALSRRLYGRVVPQVLLTHMGAWSAATLELTLAKLDAAGARYVPLAQAQADAAYHDAGPRAGNGALLERRAGELRIDMRGIPDVEPVGSLEAVCRRRAVQTDS
jgi:peptidoglycan/xylan/chitin deacetylase (PgdA/CDA1 family)